VPGTGFAVAYPTVASTPSGPAIGSLVAGIGSILVSIVVACFGMSNRDSGMGPLVAGAFAVLAGLIALGGLGLGIFAARQIRRSGRQVTGFGLAISGISCSGVGLALTVLAMVASFFA
jgi:hypothetical protein